MSTETLKRAILPTSKEFKSFWKDQGPFRYALTSSEFPPVLLEPEEWIFSDDLQALLKTLMQFEKRKMKMVKSPFNPENKSILRPDELSSWKISQFPEEWNACTCDSFIPEGHLTKAVFDTIKIPEAELEPGQVEAAFFQSLASQVEQLGYLLLKPEGTSKYASIRTYLKEWEEDDQDAGLL